MPKSITLRYFASLQDQTNLGEENITTSLQTYAELYQFLAEKYNFPLAIGQIKVAVNDEFVDLGQSIVDQATVVFIPPVAGG